MFTNPISVWFWPFHTNCYSSNKYDSNEITDATKTGSTPTKNLTLLQSLSVLPNANG
jgi:hypothetical protein